MNIYTTMPSPVGELLLVGRERDGGVALETIDYGTTITYGQLAAQLGVPRDRIQALGAAIGANPLAVIRPCHRVIGSDGGMRGYAGGVERKQQLLAHEGALLGVAW